MLTFPVCTAREKWTVRREGCTGLPGWLLACEALAEQKMIDRWRAGVQGRETER